MGEAMIKPSAPEAMTAEVEAIIRATHSHREELLLTALDAAREEARTEAAAHDAWQRRYGETRDALEDIENDLRIRAEQAERDLAAVREAHAETLARAEDEAAGRCCAVCDRLALRAEQAERDLAETRAALRIASGETVEGDYAYPGQPEADAWCRRAQAAEESLAAVEAPPGTPAAIRPVWRLVHAVERECGNEAGRHLSSIDSMVAATIAPLRTRAEQAERELAEARAKLVADAALAEEASRAWAVLTNRDWMESRPSGSAIEMARQCMESRKTALLERAKAERERDELRAQLDVAHEFLGGIAPSWCRDQLAKADAAGLRAHFDAHRQIWIEERDALVAERDEARAALVGLSDAAKRWNACECDVRAGVYASAGSGRYGQDLATEALAACDGLVDAADATPSALAGQMRGKVLREAAERWVREWSAACTVAPAGNEPAVCWWLRALAEEAERAK